MEDPAEVKIHIITRVADPNDPPAELSIRASDPQITTVGDDFPLQQARVLEILTTTPIGMAQFRTGRDILIRSFDAAIEGDILKIMASYEELKGFQE